MTTMILFLVLIQNSGILDIESTDACVLIKPAHHKIILLENNNERVSID
jgi:hypothetical protein